MAVNTWNGSSSTDFATAANWTTTGVTDRVPTAADDVIIPDTSSINKCVLDQARNVNSFVMATDGEFDAGNTLYIKGKNAAGEAIKAQGKLGDVTDFTIETASAATVILTKQSGSGSFRDLTINHASADITLAAAMSLGRNLTITAGTLAGGSVNHSFGSLTIASGGTYNATSGTTTLTDRTAAGTRSFYNNGGTFTHNNGTIHIDTSASTNYDFDGDDLYNFTVECEDTNGATNCDGQASTPVTVLNNLDIIMGILRTNGNTFTVHGNVYVRATSKTNKNKFVGQQVTQNVYGLITVEDGAFFDLANEGSGSYGTLNAGGIRIL